MFELALNGIGGNSVHQVKTNLTMVEIKQWAEYRYRRGSLNVGRRVEQAVANMMAIYINSQRQKEDWVEVLELMPHEDDVEVGFEEQIEN